MDLYEIKNARICSGGGVQSQYFKTKKSGKEDKCSPSSKEGWYL